MLASGKFQFVRHLLECIFLGIVEIDCCQATFTWSLPVVTADEEEAVVVLDRRGSVDSSREGIGWIQG